MSNKVKMTVSIDEDAALHFWLVEHVAFIQDISGLAQHQESMRKTGGHEDLTAILSR